MQEPGAAVAQRAENARIFGGDVYPGGPGMVVRDQDGERILQGMTWGFPLPLKSKLTGQPIKPKPVNNIADLTRPPTLCRKSYRPASLRSR